MRNRLGFIKQEVREKRAAAGRQGGYATFFKYGREKMRDWGRRGGRPRSLTLAELESQFSAQESQNILNKRRDGLPGCFSDRISRGASNLKIKEGELAVAVPVGPPERRE